MSTGLDNLDAIYRSAALEELYGVLDDIEPSDCTVSEILGVLTILRAAQARRGSDCAPILHLVSPADRGKEFGR